MGGNTALRVFPVATTADQLIYTGLQQQNPSLTGSAPGNNGLQWKTAAKLDSSPNRDKIAIIGMAGRFPEAATTEALWDILRLGLDVSKEVPPLRWSIKTHVDPSGRKKNSSRTSLGCWLNDPDVFDADFFGISAQEATRMDPAQRLALMTAYEAVEQAGIVWTSSFNGDGTTPSTRRDRVGVYYGVSGNDWRDCNAAQKVDSHYMRASNRAFISGRIAETFNLTGPSLTVDTSSSNSLEPVRIACRSLWAQETDMCIVGGADVMTNPDVHAGLDRAGLLSRSGNCKVFDKTADGFCRGEGVVSIVLKRLEDALVENDTVLGVIAGTATNYNSASPAGDESAQSTIQQSLFTEVLNKSNVDPASITYVEMDGSSTKLGDANEVACAVDVLAPASASKIAGKSRTLPLYLGSAMANIGHCEATSGLSSIIKVLLMFRENIIPPHIGIHTRVNSAFPVELAKHRNVHIHTGKAIKWDNDAKAASRSEPRRALIHDLGTIPRASTALILEETPLEDQGLHKCSVGLDHLLDTDQPTSYIIAISAKSKKFLHRNVANLYLWLQNEATRSQLDLAQLSYTTTARRNHYSFRTMLVVSSVEDLCAQLYNELQRTRVERNFAPTDVRPLQVANTNQAVVARPIVFAFTGSLTYKAYFRQLYESFSHIRREMHHLDQVVKRLGLPSVMKALRLKGCTVSDGGVNIYSALNVAGVLSDADTIYLAGASIQLGLLQHTKKRQSGLGEDWYSAATAEFERLDRLTTYHRGHIPVLGLVGSRASDGIPRQETWSSNARLVEGWNAPQEELKVQTWSHLTETLRMFYHAGAEIRWDRFYLDLSARSRRVISTLPAYSWDLKEYWVPYVNDWTLHKGAVRKAIEVPKLESTTIHTIIEETELVDEDSDKSRLVVEADISRHDLHGIVQGHVVDGVPLCTPSVYSDIALSLGKYMQQRYRHGCPERLINIKDMAVTKALIAQPSGPQKLRAHVEADWDSNAAICTFSTLDRRNKPQQHAQCTIMFSDTEVMDHIEQFDMAASYSKLVQTLRNGIAAHRTVRFTRNMMYRMISSLAEFHPDHKLVEDIVLDSQTHEATARVSFGQLLGEDGKHTGAFHTHPGVVDALTQPAGFALNGADTTDLDKEVYINHGWGSFYLFEPLQLTKAYTVYVHMTEGEDHIWYGDTVVLDMSEGDGAARVVALFERYSVQRMPRRVLSILLRAEGGGAYRNAKAHSGQSRQSQVGHRHDAPPKPAIQANPSPSPTLVSPVQEFEQPLRPAHKSPVISSSLPRRDHQHLHIKVDIAASHSAPPTPLTAKALTLNNEIISSRHAEHDAGVEVVKRSLEIISEESGYELADIDDDNLALADLGVDSLLSLAITSRLREELGDSLSHLDLNTLFMTYPTVASLKAALVGERASPDPLKVQKWRATTTGTTSVPLSPPASICAQDTSMLPPTPVIDPQVPQATSVILQGSPKKARATLFLFPDGSGSATSYASIPPISSNGDICVIAFNCPFLKKETSMFTCPLDALINQGYLPELHRRLGLRPAEEGKMKHTYYVGGWSAGGTLAYRAAQCLLQQEETVSLRRKCPGRLTGLVLIDAPPPIRGMDPLPDHFYKYCEQKGVFGGWSGPQARKAPDWLIPHFNGTIAVLQHYVAEPLTRAQSARLKTVACLWAGESVVGADKPLEPHPDDTEGMKFLTVQRTDFSTAGWERLVPGVDEAAILCQRLEGAHHFSLTVGLRPLSCRPPL
ncbi:hypothetical protein SLS64_009158 [Diaporthe eres]